MSKQFTPGTLDKALATVKSLYWSTISYRQPLGGCEFTNVGFSINDAGNGKLVVGYNFTAENFKSQGNVGIDPVIGETKQTNEEPAPSAGIPHDRNQELLALSNNLGELKEFIATHVSEVSRAEKTGFDELNRMWSYVCIFELFRKGVEEGVDGRAALFEKLKEATPLLLRMRQDNYSAKDEFQKFISGLSSKSGLIKHRHKQNIFAEVAAGILDDLPKGKVSTPPKFEFVSTPLVREQQSEDTRPQTKLVKAADKIIPSEFAEKLKEFDKTPDNGVGWKESRKITEERVAKRVFQILKRVGNEDNGFSQEQRRAAKHLERAVAFNRPFALFEENLLGHSNTALILVKAEQFLPLFDKLCTGDFAMRKDIPEFVNRFTKERQAKGEPIDVAKEFGLAMQKEFGIDQQPTYAPEGLALSNQNARFESEMQSLNEPVTMVDKNEPDALSENHTQQ